MSRVPVLVAWACVSMFPWTVLGQGDRQTDTWKTPPQVIRDIVDAPELPSVSVDPARAHLVLADRAGLPDLKEMARPMLRLAGHRIDPATNGRHGPGSITGLRVRRLDDGTEVRIVLPQGAEPGMPSWSPDGSRLVFTNTAHDGIELWIADPATGRAEVLLGPRLNGAMGSPYTWMPDSSTLLVRLVLKDRGPAPGQPAVPAGPAIQETAGRGAPVRTYQDLLRDAHDEALFDHYMTCQLAFLDAATGVLRNVGPPAVYTETSPSPDGTKLLVTRLRRPYSYLVTASSFADLTEVWTPEGEVTRAVTRRPVRDNVPLDGVPTGPRGVEWQDTAPATLVWVEALDGGDPKKEVSHRDRIMRLAAPFTGDPEEIWRTEHRYSGMAWLADAERVLVADYDRDRRWSRTWLASAKMTQGEPAPRLVWDKSTPAR
jgi:dipeptidyl aminopeptidase/acylaminoacyl peptidase